MWQRLFLDHVDENINLFLLVDGTHELDDEGVVDLSELSEHWQRNRLVLVV